MTNTPAKEGLHDPFWHVSWFVWSQVKAIVLGSLPQRRASQSLYRISRCWST